MSHDNQGRQYKSLKEFYPFYLSEHRDRTCRVLHFIGTFLFFLLLIAIALSGNWQYAWILPLTGYGFAWAGHFFYEKNKPATFQYPVYSLISDFKLFFEILTGKRGFTDY